ncbi:MAG: hypothetical protein NW237_00455 [Cyanobacteriota bacterium]|nr:hypothetical protein [Cyanobacteriota bacterium]
MRFCFSPSLWLALCCSGSTVSVVLWAGAALAQVQPLPTDMPGYDQFWIQQTPSQRVDWVRRQTTTTPPDNSLADPPQASEDKVSSFPQPIRENTATDEQAAGVGSDSPPPLTQPSATAPQNPVIASTPSPISPQPLTPAERDQQRLTRLLADGRTALAARQSGNPPPATPAPQPLDPTHASLPTPPSVEPVTAVTQASHLQLDPQPQAWVRSDSVVEALDTALLSPPSPTLLSPPSPPVAAPTLVATLPERSLAPSVYGAPGETSFLAYGLLEQFPLLETSSRSTLTPAVSPPQPAPADGILPSLWAEFPLLQGVNLSSQSGSAGLPSSQGISPLPIPLANRGTSPGSTAYHPALLAEFPLFGVSSPTSPELTAADPKGSQLRQQLEANLQADIPLDPDQLNVTGDVLSYQAEQQVGIAEGNARIRLSDGTTITGDKLLFYRREKRLRSEGPFLLTQPPNRSNKAGRQIQGRNLDLDIPSRSAQFESSLVIMPGEAPGTKVYIRSEETTALLGDQIFFENATITTSPEAPITHYVKGDRVEVFPDDRVLVYDARVFGGGKQDANGDLEAGIQIGYFPLFVYSLKDHQWILPGQSEEEGVYVKSSWAYQFDQYNFGGLRIDAMQKKGLGLGFVHDYILPIPDSTNYGRAQFYLVTEADQNRMSSRFRVDHFFDFYASNILGNYGGLKGQLNINFDNTYRPSGGRNDNADFRLNTSYRADLSTTTLNISRTGSQERGTYSLPITLNHNQQYGGVRWLKSDLRLDYNQRLTSRDGNVFSDARFTFNTQAKPPGWLGDYQLTYRTYGSSNGDRESRKNLELRFTPDAIKLTRDISFSTNLLATQNQQPDRENNQKLNYFNKYEIRSSLRFSEIKPADWIRINPGSVEYFQALYSTPDQESTVTLNPRLTITPAKWSSIDMRYNRVFNGNNSVPFESISSNPKDTDRINANISFFTPKNTLPNVPPGYIAFEDDLPGELAIALTFPDDTTEDLAAIADKSQAELQASVRNLLRLDTTAGYDFVSQKWDLLNANFTWNTAPNLFDVQLQTGYDLNNGEFRPFRLQYKGRTTTTFDRNLRSGLDNYEPGFSYGLQAVYDPKKGEISDYSLDLDATIGTQWQNHWRFRLGLTEEGIRRVEVRRDLRDFEVRLAYDPTAQLLRLEGILVAFPSRPVGLSQERGEFLLTTPTSSFSSDSILP